MLLALKILLTVILAAIFSAVLLLLLFLIIPLTYEFSLTGRPSSLQIKFLCRNPICQVQIQRVGSKTACQLRIFNRLINRGAKKKSSTATSAAFPGQKKLKSSWALLRKAVGDSTLRARALKFILALWKNFKPRQLNINACIGFSEPHYTGWLMAIAAILQADNSSYSIHIEGNWLEPGLEGNLFLAGRFIPALIIGQILQFLLSPEIRSYYNIRRRLTIARA